MSTTIIEQYMKILDKELIPDLANIVKEYMPTSLKCTDISGNIIFLTQEDKDLTKYRSIEVSGTFVITEKTKFKHIENILGKVVCIGDMSKNFVYCSSFEGQVSNWDVSNATNTHIMLDMLYKKSTWNLSNVNNMYKMFESSSCFDNNIDKWPIVRQDDMNILMNRIL
jgi:surface protein